MGKIMIVDEKMNSVIVETSPKVLKLLGITQENVKNHKSRRQLIIELCEFVKNSQ